MTESNRRVRVISGAGRYSDPWHDFPATSARIAEIAGVARYRGLVGVRCSGMRPTGPGASSPSSAPGHDHGLLRTSAMIPRG